MSKSKNYSDLYQTNYYVRVNDINANEGMTVASAVNYFLNAVKDNQLYNNKIISSSKIKIFGMHFPKDITVITKVYKKKDNLIFKQKIYDNDILVAKAKLISIP